MAVIPVIDAGPDAGHLDTAPWNKRPMTVDEFYAFTDTRPDGEKWELIEGEPVLNASPSSFHQWIVINVVVALKIREREINAPWAKSQPMAISACSSTWLSIPSATAALPNRCARSMMV